MFGRLFDIYQAYPALSLTQSGFGNQGKDKNSGRPCSYLITGEKIVRQAHMNEIRCYWEGLGEILESIDPNIKRDDLAKLLAALAEKRRRGPEDVRDFRLTLAGLALTGKWCWSNG